MSTKAITHSLLISLSMLTAGCGNVSQGPSPSLVQIISLAGAQGNKPTVFSQNLSSDVITNVGTAPNIVPTIFNDVGQVTMELTLKNPGSNGVTTTPSNLNVVTFTHYHVEYIRTDGHNVQGVDVPYAFDNGLTFAVTGSATADFDLVRLTAKQEAPLQALQFSGLFINTIANVTFYGQDAAGNNVTVTGSIGIVFGNFGDPTS